jgi:hypothetical protein
LHVRKGKNDNLFHLMRRNAFLFGFRLQPKTDALA